MRSSPFNRPLHRRGPARTNPPGPQVPATQPPVPDSGWHESSYELMRGVEVIECEWPDTATGMHELE